jgi:molecular chaperone Hsp33
MFPAMTESTEPPAGLEVRTYFVRNRNALLARADFGELYVDYYLHQGQFGYHHTVRDDILLKDTLAAATLHAASRPRNEISAWTLHFSDLNLNIFVTSDNPRGAVVGQLFTEQVKEDGLNTFIAEIARPPGEPRRSVVDLNGTSVFPAVERYYAQSEQRPARLFRHGEEDFVMISAQPDCDLAWLEGLDEDAIRALDQAETLSLLETRHYHWSCGCTELRMMQVLAPLMLRDPEALYAGEASLRMSCPRCGARYTITREAMEAYLVAPPK